MARKQVDRTLPPLETLCDAFQGFPPEANRQALILAELRQLAKKLRRKETQPFYAMRDVAAFYKVPLRSVAIAYERLELEGILNRIRGSKTMLAGKTISPSKPVRAVIGIPLWLHAIVVSPYSRQFHIELEGRLRNCGFVADIIFFRGTEVTSPDFAARLLHHNLDYVIWHTPHPLINQVLLSLKDSGVRQILIQPADNPLSLELPTYLQDWQSGYKQMAANWHEAGIRHLITPKPVYLPSQKAMRAFAAIMSAHGLKVDYVADNAPALRDAALRHKGSTCGVAFLDQLGADAICNGDPTVVEEIMAHCRVAFCRGPIRVPYFSQRDATADQVFFSASDTAARLANDLRDNNLPSGKTATFQAQFQQNVPFRNHSDVL
jgi:hypothetical protein